MHKIENYVMRKIMHLESEKKQYFKAFEHILLILFI